MGKSYNRGHMILNPIKYLTKTRVYTCEGGCNEMPIFQCLYPILDIINSIKKMEGN